MQLISIKQTQFILSLLVHMDELGSLVSIILGKKSLYRHFHLVWVCAELHGISHTQFQGLCEDVQVVGTVVSQLCM